MRCLSDVSTTNERCTISTSDGILGPPLYPFRRDMPRRLASSRHVATRDQVIVLADGRIGGNVATLINHNGGRVK
jgi:hypothetical protein